jgi:hypothetical protein
MLLYFYILSSSLHSMLTCYFYSCLVTAFRNAAKLSLCSSSSHFNSLMYSLHLYDITYLYIIMYIYSIYIIYILVKRTYLTSLLLFCFQTLRCLLTPYWHWNDLSTLYLFIFFLYINIYFIIIYLFYIMYLYLPIITYNSRELPTLFILCFYLSLRLTNVFIRI